MPAMNNKSLYETLSSENLAELPLDRALDCLLLFMQSTDPLAFSALNKGAGEDEFSLLSRELLDGQPVPAEIKLWFSRINGLSSRQRCPSPCWYGKMVFLDIQASIAKAKRKREKYKAVSPGIIPLFDYPEEETVLSFDYFTQGPLKGRITQKESSVEDSYPSLSHMLASILDGYLIINCPVCPGHLWVQGAAAPVNELNRYYHQLFGAGWRLKDGSNAHQILFNWWNIRNADDLRDSIGWLEKEGHRELVKNPGDFIAWDFCRAAMLAGKGYLLHYFSKDEAYACMYRAARELKDRYTSWKEVGISYINGMKKFFSGDESTAFIMRLLDDPSSPWQLPWDTPLPESPPPDYPDAELSVTPDTQDALNAALASMDSPRVTRIRCAPGRYKITETVFNNVHIIGEKDRTVFWIDKPKDTVVYINSTGALIENIMFEHTTSDGSLGNAVNLDKSLGIFKNCGGSSVNWALGSSGYSNGQLHNCRFQSNNGLYAEGNSGIITRDSTLEIVETGGFCKDKASISLFSSVIKNPDFGIRLNGGCGLYAVDSDISRAKDIALWSRDGTVFLKTSRLSSETDCIYADEGSGITINECRIESEKENGILLRNAAADLFSSEVSAFENGIDADGTSEFDLTDSTIVSGNNAADMSGGKADFKRCRLDGRESAICCTSDSVVSLADSSLSGGESGSLILTERGEGDIVYKDPNIYCLRTSFAPAGEWCLSARRRNWIVLESCVFEKSSGECGILGAMGGIFTLKTCTLTNYIVASYQNGQVNLMNCRMDAEEFAALHIREDSGIFADNCVIQGSITCENKSLARIINSKVVLPKETSICLKDQSHCVMRDVALDGSENESKLLFRSMPGCNTLFIGCKAGGAEKAFELHGNSYIIYSDIDAREIGALVTDNAAITAVNSRFSTDGSGAIAVLKGSLTASQIRVETSGEALGIQVGSQCTATVSRSEITSEDCTLYLENGSKTFLCDSRLNGETEIEPEAGIVETEEPFAPPFTVQPVVDKVPSGRMRIDFADAPAGPVDYSVLCGGRFGKLVSAAMLLYNPESEVTIKEYGKIVFIFGDHLNEIEPAVHRLFYDHAWLQWVYWAMEPFAPEDSVEKLFGFLSVTNAPFIKPFGDLLQPAGSPVRKLVQSDHERISAEEFIWDPDLGQFVFTNKTGIYPFLVTIGTGTKEFIMEKLQPFVEDAASRFPELLKNVPALLKRAHRQISEGSEKDHMKNFGFFSASVKLTEACFSDGKNGLLKYAGTGKLTGFDFTIICRGTEFDFPEIEDGEE